MLFLHNNCMDKVRECISREMQACISVERLFHKNANIAVVFISDVCLEAEDTYRGSAASASPQRFDASPWPRCYGLGVVSTRGIGTSKLRYDIIIHNFHLFIFHIYVFRNFIYA